jgi:hypothetical protein
MAARELLVSEVPIVKEKSELNLNQAHDEIFTYSLPVTHF